VDTPTFELKRAEIQRRIQMRRLALDSSDNNQSNGFLGKVLSVIKEPEVLGLIQVLGQGRLVRNMAGAAVSFLLTRWARKAFK
jgi:hypothetical protein